MSNAFFVINIGNHIVQNSRDSFQAAASRWGCEYIEITEQKEWQQYPPQFMKLDAFKLTDAERIFCIDADTVIRADTPSPFDKFPSDVFHACKNKQSHMGAYIGLGAQLEKSELEKIYGAGFDKLDFQFNYFFNSGVWVGDRKSHDDILRRAMDVGLTTGTLGWWDQAALNYAMAEAKAPVCLLDSTWNWCLPNFGQWHTMKKYIYHFAGMPDRLQIIPQIDWRACC